MNYKIVSDSSCDLYELQNCPYESVPLKVITEEKEFIDNNNTNVDEMIDYLKNYKGRSRSSCPNTNEWKDAFEGADGVFCVTITSGLSGSYNSAKMALDEYLTENPAKKGCVIDTLSAGPECALIVEKLEELISLGLGFDEIEERIHEYMKRTHLVFCLESLTNFANNGRVNATVAKVAGILGIRVVGKASDEGTLAITDKVRGADRALNDIFKNILKNGYSGGVVRIHHCRNEVAAKKLSVMLKNKFSDAIIKIKETGVLCSFYAEPGGLLIGFEET